MSDTQYGCMACYPLDDIDGEIAAMECTFEQDTGEKIDIGWLVYEQFRNGRVKVTIREGFLSIEAVPAGVGATVCGVVID